MKPRPHRKRKPAATRKTRTQPAACGVRHSVRACEGSSASNRIAPASPKKDIEAFDSGALRWRATGADQYDANSHDRSHAAHSR
jgi:hypothetical protein